MDYYLENTSMGMQEKNKALFASMIEDSAEIMQQKEEETIDTFKMYSSFIKEKDGILKIINEMCEFSLNPSTEKNEKIKSLESLIEFKNRIIMIFQTYQEQAGLIDPILPIIIPLISNTSLKLIEDLLIPKEDSKDKFEYLTCLYQVIYILCKMRGFSPIAKFFSSEVSIFENVINFLTKNTYGNSNSWFVNYVLVLWTSILAMVPFDIDTIDSEGSLISNLISYLKNELSRSTNLRIITAYALGKFLTRPDLIKKNHLEEYFKYCTESMFNKETNGDIFKMIGIALSLCEIFKNGQPQDLSKYIPLVVNEVIPFKFPDSIKTSGIFRKNMTKLIQRVGISLLKPRNQNWRYHLILKNVLGKPNEENKKMEVEEEEDSLNYEIDFSILESIIDYLMNNLSDKEYIVRWSAAKGIGRICERLPKNMVEEILHNIFDLFKDEENDFAWHGACLSIAELSKRGMILPERLKELVPLLEKALIYEINKGAFCSGSSVRDSACYIVWALARGYSTEIMKEHVNKLASSLILTILFDKEINCRRAASAAFQENVGRQGNFPHGIEILTEADYFTLGNRDSCYLNVSLFIAQYEEYYKTIVDYLCFNRLAHIEKAIRELAAESIALLVPFHPEYFTNEIIPKLIKYATSYNVHSRHGSILGIGHILLGLKGKWDFFMKSRKNRKEMLSSLSIKDKKILEDSDYRKEFDKFYDSIKEKDHFDLVLNNQNLINQIVGLISVIDTDEFYRGKGNEVMRYGVNEYVRLLSEVNIPIESKDFIYFHEILIDNIRQTKVGIQDDACNALKKFNSVYGEKFSQEEEVNQKLEKMFLNVVTFSVMHDNLAILKGYTNAVCSFNKNYLFKHFNNVIQALSISSKMKKTNNDSLIRKGAIEGIGYMTMTFLKEKKESLDKNIQTIIEGFSDYELDQKFGDVGSNVRTACVTNILDILFLLFKEKYFEDFKKYVLISINMVLKQMAERMIQLRRVAGNSLQKFFYKLKDYDQTEIESLIPNYKEISKIFLEDIRFDFYGNIDNVEWLESEYSYPKMMKILYLDEYSNSFIEGLIRSIASITEDTQKGALEELKKILEKDEKNRGIIIKKIFDVCIDMLTKHKKEDKYTESVECALVALLQMNLFINNDYIEKIDMIQRLLIQENYASCNIHKVLAGVDIYYNMLFYEKEEKYNILKRCIKSMLYLMCHKYPIVRKKASEKFFIFLSGLDEPSSLDINEDEFDEISLTLADTDWTQKVNDLRTIRNRLAEILKITL
ncbi:MAG: tubulin-specific chaperone D [archaeon]|nr:tubulin-specific chaperone D [archaeon]